MQHTILQLKKQLFFKPLWDDSEIKDDLNILKLFCCLKLQLFREIIIYNNRIKIK